MYIENQHITSYERLAEIVAEFLIEAALECHNDMITDNVSFASRRTNPDLDGNACLTVKDVGDLARSSFNDILADYVDDCLIKQLATKELAVQIKWRFKK